MHPCAKHINSIRLILLLITGIAWTQSYAQTFFSYRYKDALFSQAISQVTATKDGGVIAAGSTYSWDTAMSGLTIVKYSSSGLVQWAKIIALKANWVGSNSIVELDDGNYFITAISFEHFYTIIIKLDASGNFLFSKIINNFFITGVFNFSNCIVADNDGIIMAGLDTINLYSSVLRLDGSGNLTWAYTYSTLPYINQTVIKVVSDLENNFYVISNQNSSRRIQVLKINNAGNPVWYKEILRNDSISLVLSNAHLNSSESKVVISGSTGGDLCFAIAIDSSGNSIYAKTYTGELFYFMQSSGSMSGYNYFSFGRIILITDSMGRTIDNFSFTEISENCYYRFAETSQDNKLIMAGHYYEDDDSAAQSLLTKIDFAQPVGCEIRNDVAVDSPIEVSVIPIQLAITIQTVMVEDQFLNSYDLSFTREVICPPFTLKSDADETAFIIVPNPADNYFTLEMTSTDFANGDYVITDISGKLIKKGELKERITEFDLRGIAKGMYFMKISSGSEHSTIHKFIKKS